jgi:hypothetical protein
MLSGTFALMFSIGIALTGYPDHKACEEAAAFARNKTDFGTHVCVPMPPGGVVVSTKLFAE